MNESHVSLKQLFGIVAFCAFVAWCAAQVGFDNMTFWFMAGVSAVLSFIFVSLAQSEKGRRFALLVPLPLAFCCFLPFGSGSLMVNGLLLFIVGIFCACRTPLQVSTLWLIVMVCAMLAFAAGVVPGILEGRRLAALQQEFPIVNLENRLQYEQNRSRPETISAVLNANVLARLRDLESDSMVGNYRSERLKRIHDRQYDRFVRAIGFGVGRMLRPRAEWIRRPALQNIPFSTVNEDTVPEDTVPEDEAESYRNAWNALLNLSYPRSSDVEQLHIASRIDFLDPESFGAVIQPGKQVVGFVEHGFHYSPTKGLENENEWNIVRLELVSLLKSPEPRVYVLDHLPRMDQLSGDDVPTRPLDEFESDALERLWTEEDLVISQKGQEYRMLGSLRAAQQCLNCHDVERGELLGAFSYELRRAEPED